MWLSKLSSIQGHCFCFDLAVVGFSCGMRTFWLWYSGSVAAVRGLFHCGLWAPELTGSVVWLSCFLSLFLSPLSLPVFFELVCIQCVLIYNICVILLDAQIFYLYD